MKFTFHLGAYVPLTETGSIIVDGVQASTYASFDHHKAHLAMAPLRWFPWLTLGNKDEGISLYVRLAKGMARTFQSWGLL